MHTCIQIIPCTCTLQTTQTHSRILTANLNRTAGTHEGCPVAFISFTSEFCIKRQVTDLQGTSVTYTTPNSRKQTKPLWTGTDGRIEKMRMSKQKLRLGVGSGIMPEEGSLAGYNWEGEVSCRGCWGSHTPALLQRLLGTTHSANLRWYCHGQIKASWQAPGQSYGNGPSCRPLNPHQTLSSLFTLLSNILVTLNLAVTTQ